MAPDKKKSKGKKKSGKDTDADDNARAWELYDQEQRQKINDAYKTLHVPWDMRSEAAVFISFRTLSRAFHPDHAQESERKQKTEMFQKLGNARDFLESAYKDRLLDVRETWDKAAKEAQRKRDKYEATLRAKKLSDEEMRKRMLEYDDNVNKKIREAVQARFNGKYNDVEYDQRKTTSTQADTFTVPHRSTTSQNPASSSGYGAGYEYTTPHSTSYGGQTHTSGARHKTHEEEAKAKYHHMSREEARQYFNGNIPGQRTGTNEEYTRGSNANYSASSRSKQYEYENVPRYEYEKVPHHQYADVPQYKYMSQEEVRKKSGFY